MCLTTVTIRGPVTNSSCNHYWKVCDYNLEHAIHPHVYLLFNKGMGLTRVNRSSRTHGSPVFRTDELIWLFVLPLVTLIWYACDRVSSVTPCAHSEFACKATSSQQTLPLTSCTSARRPSAFGRSITQKMAPDSWKPSTATALCREPLQQPYTASWRVRKCSKGPQVCKLKALFFKIKASGLDLSDLSAQRLFAGGGVLEKGARNSMCWTCRLN